jgi:hypothetical protein
MPPDAGVIRFLSLGMLIVVVAVIALGYLTS